MKAGDLYTLHHVAYTVKHPTSGKKLGTKIETTGWVKVILVQEDTACAVIERACLDVHAGDYLRPFEKVNVPMVVRRAPAECCAPANGKIARHVVDLQDDATIAGEGQFLTIDAGTDDGVAPGSVFSVFRIVYPSVPTPRSALGEATVVSVRDRTATAKVTYSARRDHGGRRGRAPLAGVWGALSPPALSSLPLPLRPISSVPLFPSRRAPSKAAPAPDSGPSALSSPRPPRTTLQNRRK